MGKLISALLSPVRALLPIIEYRVQNDRTFQEMVTREFHALFYNAYATGRTWFDVYWLGVPIRKCPLDLWSYQEILFETRPDLIIETGTAFGGSALFLASMCDVLSNGRVVSIDVMARPDRPKHERITYLAGSSTSQSIVDRVRSMVRPGERVMAILDSDHSMQHVLRELRAFGPLVSKGCYLVVEDTNINGHPVAPHFGPGPWEAVDEFLSGNDDFVADRSKEKFILTFNPRGFLRRVTGGVFSS